MLYVGPPSSNLIFIEIIARYVEKFDRVLSYLIAYERFFYSVIKYCELRKSCINEYTLKCLIKYSAISLFDNNGKSEDTSIAYKVGR